MPSTTRLAHLGMGRACPALQDSLALLPGQVRKGGGDSPAGALEAYDQGRAPAGAQQAHQAAQQRKRKERSCRHEGSRSSSRLETHEECAFNIAHTAAPRSGSSGVSEGLATYSCGYRPSLVYSQLEVPSALGSKSCLNKLKSLHQGQDMSQCKVPRQDSRYSLKPWCTNSDRSLSQIR